MANNAFEIAFETVVGQTGGYCVQGKLSSSIQTNTKP